MSNTVAVITSAPSLSQLVGEAPRSRQDMERLLARCRPIVHALILDRVRNPELAEDLTQEALTDLSESLPHLRDRQAFTAWLREIAINRCRMWWRRPELELQPLSEEYQRLVHDDTFAEAARRESWRELQRALDDLPETSRLALLMHVVGGLSQAEVGEILGITVTAVGVRIHRARRGLRRILQPLSPISEEEWDNVR